MLLDNIPVKYSSFRPLVHQIKMIPGLILPLVIRSEMQLPNLTEFLGLGFFVFGHLLTPNFSIHARDSSKSARKNT